MWIIAGWVASTMGMSAGVECRKRVGYSKSQRKTWCTEFWNVRPQMKWRWIYLEEFLQRWYHLLDCLLFFTNRLHHHLLLLLEHFLLTRDRQAPADVAKLCKQSSGLRIDLGLVSFEESPPGSAAERLLTLTEGKPSLGRQAQPNALHPPTGSFSTPVSTNLPQLYSISNPRVASNVQEFVLMKLMLLLWKS